MRHEPLTQAGRLALAAVVHQVASTGGHLEPPSNAAAAAENEPSIRNKLGRLFSARRRRKNPLEEKQKEEGETQKPEQVVEFKFDLIVEAQGGDEEPARRLSAGLDELVEAFVLEAGDVCLVSVAGAAGTQPAEAECAGRLAARALAHAFRLLEGAAPARSYSVELGASVFGLQKGGSLSARDLLAPPPSQRQQDDFEESSVDCASLGEALEALERVLESAHIKGAAASPRLLLIHLKLKRRINGGLFSNRMSLIDFQPQLAEFQPILEAIFSGQALSHLRRRRQACQDQHQDQHHQAASSSPAAAARLLQAEWAIYRQLSAALLRTLVLVHVRRLVSTAPRADELEQQALMRDNLQLLQFAHALQRASSQRLRRRKRHLRAHLAAASSSALSLASQQSATLLSSDQSTRMAAAETATAGHNRGHRSLSSRCLPLHSSLALARHRRRHLRQRHAPAGRRAPFPAAADRSSGPELTGAESSSPSTSSGGGGCGGGGRRRIISHLSDDSDSLASAHLLSGASSSHAHSRRPSLLNQPPPSRIIQIDCQPTLGKTSAVARQDSEGEELAPEEPITDLEPPKQLRLEQFLSQLSSFVAPAAAAAAAEDDEDCKSHSSILEHLSSLALESNAKLEQRQQSLGCCDSFPATTETTSWPPPPPPPPPQPQPEQPAGGHLQRLLKSSAQLTSNSRKAAGSPRVALLRHPPAAGFSSSSSGSDLDSQDRQPPAVLASVLAPVLAAQEGQDLYASVTKHNHRHLKT